MSPGFPWATLREAGEAEIVKLARRGHRQRDRGVLLDPAAIAGHGDGISPRRRARPHRDGHGRSCQRPAPGIVCGLKLTVVPEGNPEADRLIALLKPPLMAVVIVGCPLIPLRDGKRGR